MARASASTPSRPFLRCSYINRFNDWFEAFDEGSKGESLSLVLGVKFLRDNIPQVTMIPEVPGFTFAVYLFLLYLHDQLGFGWTEIIAAGGRTLSDVYSHLTGDDRATAFSTFADLVSLHYPLGLGVSYFPLLETVFPVPSLRSLLAPSQVSWVSNGPPAPVQVIVDQLGTVTTPIALSSDVPATADVPGQVTLAIGSAAVSAPLQVPVPGQPETFTDKAVTITAGYAGRTLTCEIQVVRPEDLVLPALEIDVVTAGDPCQQAFAEGTALTPGRAGPVTGLPR